MSMLLDRVLPTTFALGAIVCSLSAWTAPTQTDVLVAQPASVDLGLLRQNVQYLARFTLANRTASTIRVRRIEQSCSCASHSLSLSELTAGQTAELLLKWNTGASRGRGSARAVVYYTVGEGTTQILTLKVTGLIEPNIRITPPSLAFDQGGPADLELEFAGESPFPFHILDVATSHASLSAVELPRANPTSPARVRVSWKSTGNATGSRAEELIVVTDDPVETRLRVPIHIGVSKVQP